MGRKTYESIGTRLVKRHNIVVSNSPDFIPQGDKVPTLFAALETALKYQETVWIIGGAQLYQEAIEKYLYYCDNIYESRLHEDYDCDRFFHLKEIYTGKLQHLTRSHKMIEVHSDKQLTINQHIIDCPHPEVVYLNLLQEILDKGNLRGDRTGVGTLSLFGMNMRFDLRLGFPLLTTKKMWFKGIKEELLFFISGSTNTKLLEAKGVNIWKDNTTTDFLSKRGLTWSEGDMGPSYGFQWRHAGATYQGADKNYHEQGIDQLQLLIDGLANDPFSRRHIINSWNTAQVEEMVLPPCHCLCQFYVLEEKGIRYLDCCLYQRSGDMFLGVPYNIASYALLTALIAKLVNYVPRYFIHNIGDAHIYTNHVEQVKIQLQRQPLPLPQLVIKQSPLIIDHYVSEDIVVSNYQSWDALTAKMAV